MSKKRARTCCLVIDASIAEAAGTSERSHPNAARCRDFLAAVRNNCHRMAWSEPIVAEWDKHKRGFAALWLVSMRNLRKLRHVQDETWGELREAIEAHSKDQNVVRIMVKDSHLIQAALATDSRIASLDDAVRGHFSRLAAEFPPLRPIMWVNPVTEGAGAVGWLETGAKAQRSRRLKP